MADQDLPIDIHYGKLIDWLVDRHKTTLQWAKELAPVRASISKAQVELPLHIKTSLEGKTIHYYECQNILRLLEEEEKKAGNTRLKNLFGSYTSDLLKAWDAILKGYEKNGIFLAEAGRILTNNVDVQIPNLKKSIQQSDKQVADLSRKITDSLRSSKDYERKYEEACSALSLKGKDLRKEVKASVKELPSHVRDIEDKVNSEILREALEFYQQFSKFYLKFVHAKQADDMKLCETLGQFCEKVRAADYEQNHKTFRQQFGLADEDEKGGNNDDDAVEIDIDWDITVEDSADSGGGGAGASGGAIDWSFEDDAVVVDSDAVPVADDTAADDSGVMEIDWGLEVEEPGDSSAAAGDAAQGDDTQQPEEDEKQFVDPSGLSLVDAGTRQAFLTNVLELEAFLHQRHREMEQAPVALMDASAPVILQKQTVDSVGQYLKCVREVLAAVKNSRFQQLLLIRGSERYVDRLVSSLDQKLKSAERLKATASKLELRQQELRASMQRAQRKLAGTVAATKELKAHVEQTLSKQYDGRVVNLFGDISQL